MKIQKSSIDSKCVMENETTKIIIKISFEVTLIGSKDIKEALVDIQQEIDPQGRCILPRDNDGNMMKSTMSWGVGNCAETIDGPKFTFRKKVI